MIVLVDLDGVVADIDSALNRYIQAKFPDAQVVDESSWDFETKFGLPDDALNDFFSCQRTFRDLPVIAGAQQAVAKLAEVADVWFCSTPVLSPWCASEKYEWVCEHFYELRRKLILTKDKTLVVGDYLIDDKLVIEGVRKPDWTHIWYNEQNFTWDNVDELIRRVA